MTRYNFTYWIWHYQGTKFKCDLVCMGQKPQKPQSLKVQGLAEDHDPLYISLVEIVELND